MKFEIAEKGNPNTIKLTLYEGGGFVAVEIVALHDLDIEDLRLLEIHDSGKLYVCEKGAKLFHCKEGTVE